MRQVPATVHEDGVGRWCIEQCGALGWRDPHLVKQQTERRKYLSGRCHRIRQQEQLTHVDPHSMAKRTKGPVGDIARIPRCQE